MLTVLEMSRAAKRRTSGSQSGAESRGEPY
jgi:hypothetical protein